MSDSKVFAFLGVFLTVIGFLVVFLTKKNDKYAMFYAKQGLVLFFASLVVWVGSLVLAFIPVIGWLALMALYVGWLVLWVLAMVNSLSGKMKPTPLVGQFAEKLKF